MDTAPLATCQISNRWVISGKSSLMYFAICLCLSVTSVPMRSAPTVLRQRVRPSFSQW